MAAGLALWISYTLTPSPSQHEWLVARGGAAAVIRGSAFFLANGFYISLVSVAAVVGFALAAMLFRQRS